MSVKAETFFLQQISSMNTLQFDEFSENDFAVPVSEGVNNSVH